MKVCSLHQIEAVHKEGVSKTTGKPYSFWACPEKVNGGYCKADIVDQSDNYSSTQDFEKSLKDTHSRRIERQHSQEMALRFLALQLQTGQVKTVTQEMVAEQTDYFAKDLD